MKKNTGIQEYRNTGIFLIDFHDIVIVVVVITSMIICHMIHCIYDVLVDLVVVVTYRQVV